MNTGSNPVVVVAVEELVHFDIEIETDVGSAEVVQIEVEPKVQHNCRKMPTK